MPKTPAAPYSFRSPLNPLQINSQQYVMGVWGTVGIGMVLGAVKLDSEALSIPSLHLLLSPTCDYPLTCDYHLTCDNLTLTCYYHYPYPSLVTILSIVNIPLLVTTPHL